MWIISSFCFCNTSPLLIGCLFKKCINRAVPVYLWKNTNIEIFMAHCFGHYLLYYICIVCYICYIVNIKIVFIMCILYWTRLSSFSRSNKYILPWAVNLQLLTKNNSSQRSISGHPLSTYAKFSEKLTFLTPWYAHIRVRIRGLEMLVVSENFAYVLNGWPLRDTVKHL